MPLKLATGSRWWPLSALAERPFKKGWYEDKIAQGRLRMSDDLDEARTFYHIEGQSSVRIDVGFGDFHRHNLAYHCGTANEVNGSGSKDGSEYALLKSAVSNLSLAKARHSKRLSIVLFNWFSCFVI